MDTNKLKFKVFIVSKGRCSTAKTPTLLEAFNIEYTLVVVPSQYGCCKKNFPNAEFFVLPEYVQGIDATRAYIHEMYKEKYNYVWLLDKVHKMYPNVTKLQKKRNSDEIHVLAK